MMYCTIFCTWSLRLLCWYLQMVTEYSYQGPSMASPFSIHSYQPSQAKVKYRLGGYRHPLRFEDSYQTMNAKHAVH